MEARVSSLAAAIFFAVRRQSSSWAGLKFCCVNIWRRSSSWLRSVHFTGGDDNFFVERRWTGLMLCEHWRWCPSWLRNVPYCGGDDDKIFPLWGVGPLRFVLGLGSHSHQESVVVPSLTSVCLLGECHTPWWRNEPFAIPCCGVRREVLSFEGGGDGAFYLRQLLWRSEALLSRRQRITCSYVFTLSMDEYLAPCFGGIVCFGFPLSVFLSIGSFE